MGPGFESQRDHKQGCLIKAAFFLWYIRQRHFQIIKREIYALLYFDSQTTAIKRHIH